MGTNEGFKLDFIESLDNYKINNLGIISLKRAMLSFFSTYEGLMRNVNVRESEENDLNYPDSYLEYYIDCIVFFQHFFELTIKDLLAYDSELLITTYKYKESIEPLYDLIHGNETNTDTINSVEFSDALDRIKTLVGKIYPDGSFDFLKKYLKSLKMLNNYRNRAIHRGRFILRFEELDKFIGNCIFPIIQEIFDHPYYKDHISKWKYTSLNCGIDPFCEIMDESNKPNPNYKKIALLKELGRAAYKKPKKIRCFGRADEKRKKLTEQKILASIQFETSLHAEQLSDHLDFCPVCGEKSLYSFEEYDYDDEKFYEWIDSVKCMWCTYELDCSYIGDISGFRLTGLHNYFKR